MSKTFAGIMQQILNNSMEEGINYEFKIPTAPVIREPGHRYTPQEKALNTHLLKEQMAMNRRMQPQRPVEPVQPARQPIRHFDTPHCLRLVESREPYLEVYYGHEVEERHQAAFQRQQNELSKRWTRSTPGKTVTVDLNNGEIVQVNILMPNGHIIGSDHFYKNMIRTDAQHEWAANVSQRGIAAGSRIPLGNQKRKASQIRGEINSIEKGIREMRFMERFLCGENRHEIAHSESLTPPRVMDIIEDGVRRLARRYANEIVFVEARGQQDWDQANYPDSTAFMWPRGGKEILENKDVLLVFARRCYDEYLRPTLQQLEKEQAA